jgi:hypothetical protein
MLSVSWEAQVSEVEREPQNWFLRHPVLTFLAIVVLLIGGLLGWQTNQDWRHRHTPTASTMITAPINLHNLWPPNDDETVASATLATIVCRYLSTSADTTIGFGVITEKNWYFFVAPGQISGIPTKHLPTCGELGTTQPHTTKNTVYYEALPSDS